MSLEKSWIEVDSIHSSLELQKRTLSAYVDLEQPGIYEGKSI